MTTGINWGHSVQIVTRVPLPNDLPAMSDVHISLLSTKKGKAQGLHKALYKLERHILLVSEKEDKEIQPDKT